MNFQIVLPCFSDVTDEKRKIAYSSWYESYETKFSKVKKSFESWVVDTLKSEKKCWRNCQRLQQKITIFFGINLQRSVFHYWNFMFSWNPLKRKKNWGVSHLPWANSVSRLKHYTILKEPFKTWMHIITQYFSWEITANHSMAHLIVLNFFYAMVSHIFVLGLMIDLVKHVVSMCQRIKQRCFTKFRNPHVVSTS